MSIAKRTLYSRTVKISRAIHEQVLLCGLRTRPASPVTASLPIRPGPSVPLCPRESPRSLWVYLPGPVGLGRQLDRTTRKPTSEIGSRAAVRNYKHRLYFHVNSKTDLVFLDRVNFLDGETAKSEIMGMQAQGTQGNGSWHMLLAHAIDPYVGHQYS